MQKKQYILEKWEDDEILFADGLDDAIEYLEYNTFNAYVGEKTPIWVDDIKQIY